MKRWVILWTIVVGSILVVHLWRINSIYPLIDWVVNIYYPKLNTSALWLSIVVSATYIFAGIGFVMFRYAAKELSKLKSIWVRRYKVTKIMTNCVIFPYVIFQAIYSPIREFNVEVSNTLKIIFIIAQVCLILVAITLSIGKDNELYLKE